jgi:hypothetical protein
MHSVGLIEGTYPADSLQQEWNEYRSVCFGELGIDRFELLAVGSPVVRWNPHAYENDAGSRVKPLGPVENRLDVGP